MEENSLPQAEEANAAAVGPYCPICGDRMHIEILLDVQYRVCNDPDCGYIEPV